MVGVTVLDTTGAHGATPAAPPAPGVLDTLADALDAPDAPVADERDLRALRACLVDETLRLRRWQRLVQARLDLVTDRLSPAEAPLGPADVVALVRGRLGPDVDAADDLRAVVATRRALRARALVLAGHLAEVDAALGAHGPARRCCPRG